MVNWRFTYIHWRPMYVPGEVPADLQWHFGERNQTILEEGCKSIILKEIKKLPDFALLPRYVPMHR